MYDANCSNELLNLLTLTPPLVAVFVIFGTRGGNTVVFVTGLTIGVTVAPGDSFWPPVTNATAFLIRPPPGIESNTEGIACVI